MTDTPTDTTDELTAPVTDDGPAESSPAEDLGADGPDLSDTVAPADDAPEQHDDAAMDAAEPDDEPEDIAADLTAPVADDGPAESSPAEDLGADGPDLSDTTEPADDADDTDAPEPPRPVSPYDRPGRWYVLHTQSGYENKVRSNIIARTSSMNMEERIYEVVIPMEDVVEFKNGKKVVVQKKVFPGYLLCRMRLDDDSWFVVRNTPGVTGFVGAGNKPSPLPRRDVENFLAVKDEGEDTTRKGRPRLEFDMGENVRVKEGPFADFQGEIVEINEDQLKVKVLVNIFGRETPVELEFSQVGKV